MLLARAAASYGGEAAALRAAAAVKSQLRGRLIDRALALGPGRLGGQRDGELATLATRGLDGLDAYDARYLPSSSWPAWSRWRSSSGWRSPTGCRP